MVMKTFKFPNSEEKAIEALRELGITHQEGSPEDALISALKTHQDLNQRYPKLTEYVFSLTTWLQYLPIAGKGLTQTDNISIQRMEDLGIVLNDMFQEKINELNELNISNAKQGLDREAYTYSNMFLASTMQEIYSDIRIEEVLIKNELYRRLIDLGKGFRQRDMNGIRQWLRDNEVCQIIFSQFAPVKIFN